MIAEGKARALVPPRGCVAGVRAGDPRGVVGRVGLPHRVASRAGKVAGVHLVVVFRAGLALDVRGRGAASLDLFTGPAHTARLAGGVGVVAALPRADGTRRAVGLRGGGAAALQEAARRALSEARGAASAGAPLRFKLTGGAAFAGRVGGVGAETRQNEAGITGCRAFCAGLGPRNYKMEAKLHKTVLNS